MTRRGKAVRYTCRQLLESERYRDKKDLIHALLDPGKSYSLREVDEILEKYEKGKVR